MSRTDEHLPVNVENQFEWTILECARAVLKVTGSSSQIVHHAQDDPTQMQPDISKAKRMFGWEPNLRWIPELSAEFRETRVANLPLIDHPQLEWTNATPDALGCIRMIVGYARNRADALRN